MPVGTNQSVVKEPVGMAMLVGGSGAEGWGGGWGESRSAAACYVPSCATYCEAPLRHRRAWCADNSQ